MRRSKLVAVLLGLCSIASAADAQTVSGNVLLPDGATPAAGVIVVARDARDSVAARALTSAAGHYTLRLARDGRYALTVLRIGYRPTVGPTLDVSGATTAPSIVLSSNPVTLAAVAVRESRTCRVNVDTGSAVAQLWQEARKAMLSTELRSDDAPLDAEWIEYERELDSTGRIVRRQTVRSARHPTTHAFRSLPVAVLDTGGYVVAEQGTVHFFAPDADVLLSDPFVHDHCFSLTPPRSGAPGLVGVAFEPTRARRDQHEIAGTLWLDRTTAELRSLEFTYSGLSDAAAAAGAGGRVEFLRLDDGNWLVSRWNIRMPELQPVAMLGGGPVRIVATSSGMVVRGIQITGGEVLHVLRGDSTVYRATGASVDVQLRSRAGDLALNGSTMHLDGTGYAGTSDSTGRLVLTPVLAGRYHARVSTPLMDSLAIPPVEHDVEARLGVHADTIVMPSVNELLTHLCPHDSLRGGEGMVRGTVRDDHARVVPHAAITVTWQTGARFVDMKDGSHLNWVERTVGTLSTETGTWRVCGVPSASLLTVRVLTDSGSAMRRVRLSEPGAIEAVPLVLAPLVSHANNVLGARVAESAPVTLLEIAVTANGVQVPQVRLDITPPHGQTRTVVTDSSGHALIPDLETGVATIRARRIGLKPGQVTVTIGAGRNTAPIVMSDASVPVLQAVRVIGGQRTLARYSDFEARHLNHLATASFDEADIEKRGPVDAWQMLTGIAGVTITDRDSMVVATSPRAMVAGLNNEPCYMVVMIDGAIRNPDPAHSAFDLRQLPPPTDIHGIEVFAGPGSIPLQYAGEGAGKWCGMIAFWTK